MAAMKPRTGDGPLEVTKEGRGIVMRVPLEGGGRLVVEMSATEAGELGDALKAVAGCPARRRLCGARGNVPRASRMSGSRTFRTSDHRYRGAGDERARPAGSPRVELHRGARGRRPPRRLLDARGRRRARAGPPRGRERARSG